MSGGICHRVHIRSRYKIITLIANAFRNLVQDEFYFKIQEKSKFRIRLMLVFLN